MAWWTGREGKAIVGLAELDIEDVEDGDEESGEGYSLDVVHR